MVEHEYKLLSKAIHTGQIEKLINIGIEERHFSDENIRSIWLTIVEHTLKYKTPPSISALTEKHHTFVPALVDDSLEYVIDDFMLKTKRRMAVEQLRMMAVAVDDMERLPEIDEIFMDSARLLSQAVPSGKIARFSEMPSRIEQYKKDRTLGTNRGITTGMPTIDELTFGIQPHEFIVISGWSGLGKSTLLQHMLFSAYVKNKVTPMMVSLEMEAEALYRKWDAMAANLTYRKLKGLDLSDKEIEAWEKQAKSAKKAKNDIIVLDKMGRCTVEKIYAEANRYKPDLIGVDYISLMDTPRHAGSSIWEKVTYLTNNLKQLARSLKIPVIAVAQTNKDSAQEGAKLDNIAYSRSIGQDGDIVLGLYCDDEMRQIRKMEVRMLKNRDGEVRNIDMHWDMSRMHFTEWSVMHEFIGNNDTAIGSQNGKSTIQTDGSDRTAGTRQS